MKVSIIVPVYNVEQYLEKCLNSLVSQSIDDYEIIVVNDGTKDNSQAIIDLFKMNYPDRIVSLIKENGGLSSARNYGLKFAQGEYIAFVDSDDWVEQDMYELMYNKAKEYDFDLVMCDFYEIHGDKKIPLTCNLNNDLLSKGEIKRHLIDFYPSAWNKLYKKSLFENLEFKEGIWFEDVEFGYRLLPILNSIGVVKKCFYNYLIRSGSITSSVDPRIYHYIDNWNGILEYYLEKGIFDEYKEELEYSYVRYLFATFVKTAAKYEKKEFSKAVQTAIYNVNKNFKLYKSNSYINEKGLKNLYLKNFCSFLSKLVYWKYNK